MALVLSPSERLTLLATRMQNGECGATEELYEQLLPKVYGFLFARTGKKEISEDLAQHIFVKLIEKIEHFDRKKGRFTVWFWQMVRNTLIDYHREKKETPFSTYEEGVIESLASTEPYNIEEKMRCDEILDFLKTLTAAERTLFELRYQSEMPYKDMADVLSKSEGSLRVATLRVKGKIKKKFELAFAE
jgi:RNA polymerase sigma-70 factor (ECF subfamily)